MAALQANLASGGELSIDRGWYGDGLAAVRFINFQCGYAMALVNCATLMQLSPGIHVSTHLSFLSISAHEYVLRRE